jgi:uncharacterized protein (DUF1501 family)
MNKALVLIQLIGGNDGLNTVIPLNQYDVYRNRRPTLGLDTSNLSTFTDGYSMPSYADGLIRSYKNGNLAVIQNVGYDTQDFSHFRSTDIWMSAVSSSIENTGWAGRLLQDKLAMPPAEYPAALKIGKSSSLLFQADFHMGISITSPERFYQLVNDIEYPLPNTIWAKEAAFIRDVINQSEVYSKQIAAAYYKLSAPGDYGSSDLEAQLAIVAKLIAGGLQTEVYHVTLDGFDTHSSQADVHRNLITTLSRAIDNFQDDLERKGIADRVVGMTFSEFGRRVFENESRGTDHGAASVQFMFGKNVKGGLYGSTPDLSLDNLAVEFDFRRLYADAVGWLDGNIQSSLLAPYGPMGIISNAVTPPPQKDIRYSISITEQNKGIYLYSDNTWEEKPLV